MIFKKEILLISFFHLLLSKFISHCRLNFFPIVLMNKCPLKQNKIGLKCQFDKIIKIYYNYNGKVLLLLYNIKFKINQMRRPRLKILKRIKYSFF